MPGKLLSVEQLGDQLGVAVQTIYRWRSEGRDMPKAIKIGGRIRWRQESVDAWLAIAETKAA